MLGRITNKPIYALFVMVLSFSVMLTASWQLQKQSSEDERKANDKSQQIRIKEPEKLHAVNMGQSERPNGPVKQGGDPTLKAEETVKKTVAEAPKPKIVIPNGPGTDIVAIGDSLTQGFGSLEQGGYLYYLRKYMTDQLDAKQINILNYGVKGNRSDQLLDRLEKTELQQAVASADMVIITIGGNDLVGVVKQHFLDLTFERFAKERSAYESRLKDIFQTVRQINPGCKIYMIGLFNPFAEVFKDFKELDEVVANWNASIEQVVSQFKEATFIPIFDLFRSEEQELLYKDHFHPNDKGYELMAQRVMTYLDAGKEGI